MLQNRACWVCISVLLAVVTARVAVWLQSAGFSTVLLFPLLIGAVLGAIIGFVAWQAGETSQSLVIVGAVLAAAICAAGEHGFFYHDYRRGFEAKLQGDPKGQLAAAMNPEQFEPATFSKFMAAAAAEKWRLWIVDAVAMIGAAGVAAWLVFANGRRTPTC